MEKVTIRKYVFASLAEKGLYNISGGDGFSLASFGSKGVKPRAVVPSPPSLARGLPEGKNGRNCSGLG